MKMKVYTLAVDNDNGTNSFVFGSEREMLDFMLQDALDGGFHDEVAAWEAGEYSSVEDFFEATRDEYCTYTYGPETFFVPLSDIIEVNLLHLKWRLTSWWRRRLSRRRPHNSERQERKLP